MDNKIITKEEYLQAVEIVEKYNLQFNNIKKENTNLEVSGFTKYTIQDFLSDYKNKYSKRLGSVLLNVTNYHGDTSFLELYSVDLMKYPNCAKATRKEFEEMQKVVLEDLKAKNR